MYVHTHVHTHVLIPIPVNWLSSRSKRRDSPSSQDKEEKPWCLSQMECTSYTGQCELTMWGVLFWYQRRVWDQWLSLSIHRSKLERTVSAPSARDRESLCLLINWEDWNAPIAEQSESELIGAILIHLHCIPVWRWLDNALLGISYEPVCQLCLYYQEYNIPNDTAL